MTPDDVYTHGHHESVLRSHQWRTVENSAGTCSPRSCPGARMLDVGCGPGPSRSTSPHASPGPGWWGWTGRRGARAGAPRGAPGVDNVEFAVGDVYALDLRMTSFDVVHAHQVLQHLTDPVAALREMRRVCAPGGVVAGPRL